MSEVWQDSVTDLGVRCPCASEKIINNVVTTLVPLILIGFASFLKVTRTTIKSWIGFKRRQMRTRNAELDALERLEKSP